MTVDWQVRTAKISIAQAAGIVGIEQALLTQYSLRGFLGVPRSPSARAELSLLEFAGAIAISDGKKAGLSVERVARVLPALSGAALIDVAVASDRTWVFNRGQDWQSFASALKKASGKGTIVNEVLGLGQVDTKPWAVFSGRSVDLYNEFDEVQSHGDWPITVLSAKDIGRRMRVPFPKELFVAMPRCAA